VKVSLQGSGRRREGLRRQAQGKDVISSWRGGEGRKKGGGGTGGGKFPQPCPRWGGKKEGGGKALLGGWAVEKRPTHRKGKGKKKGRTEKEGLRLSLFGGARLEEDVSLCPVGKRCSETGKEEKNKGGGGNRSCVQR